MQKHVAQGGLAAENARLRRQIDDLNGQLDAFSRIIEALQQRQYETAEEAIAAEERRRRPAAAGGRKA